MPRTANYQTFLASLLVVFATASVAATTALAEDGVSESDVASALEVAAEVTAEGIEHQTEAADEPAAVTEVTPAVAPSEPRKLDEEMEDVKKALVKLKRDLVILEEDLLFPASSQVSVFLSMDIGDFFALDSVSLKLNGKQVTHHLYTDKQVDALTRGGVQKLYVGNVKQGQNRVTAFFTGRGPEGRDYRRATTVEFEKGFEPTFIELAITDETADYQPDFSADVVN